MKSKCYHLCPRGQGLKYNSELQQKISFRANIWKTKRYLGCRTFWTGMIVQCSPSEIIKIHPARPDGQKQTWPPTCQLITRLLKRLIAASNKLQSVFTHISGNRSIIIGSKRFSVNVMIFNGNKFSKLIRKSGFLVSFRNKSLNTKSYLTLPLKLLLNIWVLLTPGLMIILWLRVGAFTPRL